MKQIAVLPPSMGMKVHCATFARNSVGGCLGCFRDTKRAKARWYNAVFFGDFSEIYYAIAISFNWLNPAGSEDSQSHD